MSIADLRQIMERIKDAPQRSPIAVFITGTGKNLDAQFANTTATRLRIENKDPNLIGVFHSGLDGDRTRTLLQKVIKKNAETFKQ